MIAWHRDFVYKALNVSVKGRATLAIAERASSERMGRRE
jgi:hypothetical protein